jgi:hypothetical protein
MNRVERSESQQAVTPAVGQTNESRRFDLMGTIR